MADLFTNRVLPLHQQFAELTYIVGGQRVPDVLQLEAETLEVFYPVNVVNLIVAVVAVAIAVGGPGALFWILAWAAFGMTVKVAEVSLACYYRCQDSKGAYYGGPSRKSR